MILSPYLSQFFIFLYSFIVFYFPFFFLILQVEGDAGVTPICGALRDLVPFVQF